MLPHFLFQLGDRYLIPTDDGAGVVDEDIQTAVVVHGLCHQAFDLIGIG